MRSQRMPAAVKASRVSRSSASAVHQPGVDGGRVTPAVARIAGDAGHLDRGQRGELLRHPDGAGRRRLAGAVEADVELDQQLRGGAVPRQRGGQVLGRGAGVDRDGEVDAVGGDPRQPLGLLRRVGRVVHQEPRHARLREHLRLAGLRDGEAAGAERRAGAGRSPATCASSCAARAGSRARRRRSAAARGSRRAGRGRRRRPASRPPPAGGRPARPAARACVPTPSSRRAPRVRRHRDDGRRDRVAGTTSPG